MEKCGDMSNSNGGKSLILKIRSVFSKRNKPGVYTAGQLSGHEIGEVLSFAGKSWEDITCDHFEKNFEVFYWFSPEAFCYYLPGVFYVSVTHDNPDLLVIDSIIGMLDRNPDPSHWNDFFRERWLMLTDEEIDVAAEWVLWLSSRGGLDDSSLSRAFDCLESVKNYKQHK